MDKRVFDDAIGEVPRSTVDVDAVIRRGRRADRVRRVANPAVAAGVAVVLLTGAVAYTMTRDDGGPSVGTAPPPTTSSSSSSAPPSSDTAPPTTQSGVTTIEIPITPPPQCDDELEEAGVVAARLQQVVTDAVLAQRPDLQLSPNVDYPRGTPRGPLEFYQTITRGNAKEVSICDREGDFESTATTTAPDGAGNLLVLVGPDFHPDEPPSCERNGLPGMTFCEATTGQDGEKIVKQAVGFEGGTVMHRVEIVRDGMSILVQAENVGTSSKYGGPATASAPPLSLDQLVAVGTDPDLTLFP